MKKSLLALAVLGAFAGAASAQSSVTLFGIVDVNVRNTKNGPDSVQSLSTDGINSSRLGFRGVEDLGGGMKAGFWIEGALSPDTGNANGQTWQRRSTVSLMGGFGEVRLGRDYTPTFWNLTVFDPFGTNGVGSYLNLFASGSTNTPLLSGATTLVRANNTVGYFLPSGIGGLYGQVQIAAGEGVVGNKYQGGRLGYAAGPVDVAAAYGRTQIAGDRRFNMWDLGGSFTVGPAKLMAQYSKMKTEQISNFVADVDQTNWLLGAVVGLGQGEIHASYSQAKSSDLDAKAKQYALGYVYNLSKRTALYATYSRLTNDNTSFAVGTPPPVTVVNTSITAGGVVTGGSMFDIKSTGYEAGIRHSF